MQYRKFGKTGDKVSTLGFGAMRLPAYPHDGAHVDMEASVELLCRAFDLGVNYVDTAYVYRGGESEIAVGKALKLTDRKVYVSTKFPLTMNPKSGDYRRLLEEQLKRLQLDSVDYYHFHGIGRAVFDEIILPQNFLKEALQAKEESLIKHISFSFHDEPEAMKYIIDRAEIMETVLCQYNIIDRRNEDAMKYAKSKGLGVAVMGPLAGGKFIIPEESEVIKSHRVSSTADMALRFVLNNDDVDMVLSGMKSIEMLEENCIITNNREPLSDLENSNIEKMVTENRVFADCYCTECCYCLPCPSGINIPYIFRLLNFHKVDGLTEMAKIKYEQLLKREDLQVMLLSSSVPIGMPPTECINCGMCENKCPQKLQIRSKMNEIQELLKKE